MPFAPFTHEVQLTFRVRAEEGKPLMTRAGAAALGIAVAEHLSDTFNDNSTIDPLMRVETSELPAECPRAPAATVLLTHDGITRRYPCASTYDAIVLADALQRVYGAAAVQF